MEYIILSLLIVLLIISAFILFKLSRLKNQGQSADETDVKNATSNAIKDFGTLICDNIDKTNKPYIENVSENVKHLLNEMSKFRSETVDTLNKENTKNIENIKEHFDDFSKNMSEKFALIAKNVETNLGNMRRENQEKLDFIQKTVDENLQKTLEGRLKDTFDSVIKQLDKVNTAVGEIKGLAVDVGSLKNVLTNVKTKGIVGEVILGNIIEQTLTKEQYDENIATKKNSRDFVEFAVKMPAGEKGDFVYLPIDSKFPLEAYYALKDAVDSGNKEEAEKARKALSARIKNCAKDINTKYIDPPYTTDFAIMFLPVEGLYIEAIDSGLFEDVQKEYKVNIAGPSTLTALLNALQMGFKSYVIQKRSAEVFSLLKDIEKEFTKFADVLAKTQDKISNAGEELEKLVGTRTRMLQSKFKKLGELPSDDNE